MREAGPIKAHQVLIGSCTNSSYRDLMVVAAMLKGKRVHPDVSFGVVPGSRQVLRMITDNGALGAIIDSGARILESGCGFCAGYGQSPQSGGNSIRTNNRNFEGRSGTKDAKVYLVSPETAAATALTGRLTDPRDLDMAYPDIPLPDRFYINDALIIRPTEGGEEVFRGPNIGEPPRTAPLPADLRAGVAIKVGDQITTDHIIATGSVSRYRSNIPKSSEFVFQRVDPLFVQRCKENEATGDGVGHRGGVELRSGLFTRACRPLPRVPRRAGGDREEHRTDPCGEPGQFRHPAAYLYGSTGLRKHRGR